MNFNNNKSYGIKKRKFIKKNKFNKKKSGLSDINAYYINHSSFRCLIKSELNNLIFSNIDYSNINYQSPILYKDKTKTWWDDCSKKNKCYSNNKW